MHQAFSCFFLFFVGRVDIDLVFDNDGRNEMGESTLGENMYRMIVKNKYYSINGLMYTRFRTHVPTNVLES